MILFVGSALRKQIIYYMKPLVSVSVGKMIMICALHASPKWGMKMITPELIVLMPIGTLILLRVYVILYVALLLLEIFISFKLYV